MNNQHFLYHLNCSVPENIQPPPTEGIRISWRVGGSVRPKKFKDKYEAQSEFPEGWEGDLRKFPSVGEVWIFSGTTHFY